MEQVLEIPIAEAQCECWRARAWNRVRSLDKALISIAVTLVVVYAVSPHQALVSLHSVAKSLLKLSPYLMVAYLASAYMKAAGMENIVTRVFRGQAVTMTVAASFLGSFSPFCSCTVVPVIAVLLRSGIPLSAIFAFWICSPLMSPDIYFLTMGSIGPGFANARLASALGIGLFAGFATMLADRAGFLKDPLSRSMAAQGMLDVTGSGEVIRPVWKFWRDAERVAAFKATFTHTALLLTKWLIFAFLLESLMEAWLPQHAIQTWLGSSSVFAIPLSVVVGVPTYLNALVAIPFLKGLLATGVSHGAALAFTVSGGVTSIPAMMAVMPMVRKGVFLWYLGLAFVGSLISGYAYEAILNLMH
jgi:uncharacterized membrane protein YraQ (UPF0718 family)